MNRAQQIVVASFETIVKKRGLELEETDVDDGELAVTLRLSTDDETSWLEDLSHVLGAYCGALQSEGWDVGLDRLVMRFTGTGQFETRGSEAVQLTARREWAEEFAGGDLTLAEYIRRVRATGQVVDAAGEVHDLEALQEGAE